MFEGFLVIATFILGIVLGVIFVSKLQEVDILDKINNFRAIQRLFCKHYEYAPVEDLDEWELKGFGKLEWKQTFRGSQWECTKCGKKIKISKRISETYPEDMPEEGKFL